MIARSSCGVSRAGHTQLSPGTVWLRPQLPVPMVAVRWHPAPEGLAAREKKRKKKRRGRLELHIVVGEADNMPVPRRLIAGPGGQAWMGPKMESERLIT